jgi:hypothetical protein
MRIAAAKEPRRYWAKSLRVAFWPALMTSGTALGFLLTGMTRSLLGS